MHPRPEGAPPGPARLVAPRWGRLVFSVAAIFAVFDLTARALGSLRGEWGLVVCAIVLACAVAGDSWCSGGSVRTSLVRLGLGRPAARGLRVVAVVIAALAAAVVVAVALADAPWRVLDDALVLAPGLFAQAGVAEEVLFRGLLFGTVRRGEARFWRAAALSSLPFIAVHLMLFATLDWPIAALSVLLAAALSFPLPYLFELGGRTIWAPALLHAVIQGVPKLVAIEFPGVPFAAAWIVACVTLPFVVFAVRPHRT